LVGEQQEHPSS